MSSEDLREMRGDIKSIFHQISQINVSLVRATESLEHHIERTDRLEDIVLEVRDKQSKCPARLEEELREIRDAKKKELEKKRNRIWSRVTVFTSIGMMILAAITLYLQWKGTINLMP